MNSQLLRPEKETLEINGKISYRESLRAWNTIRLKKEMINEYPALKNRSDKFGYKLILYRNYAKLEIAMRKMKREGEPIPLLLFLKKEVTK